MLSDLEDPRGGDVEDLLPEGIDALDLEPEVVEGVCDRRRVGVDRGELADPRERCAHGAQYFVRKRMSLSKNVLMGSTP